MKQLQFITITSIWLIVFFSTLGLSAQRPAGAGGPRSGGPGGGDKAVLKGQLADEEGEGIPFATVALFQENGEDLLKGTTTDFDGHFKLTCPPAEYRLQISFLGLKKIDQPLTAKLGMNQLGLITMLPDESILEEVVVQGEKSTMELKLDKRVFTVGKDMTSIGGSATELLDNVPSVNVDIEGNVSMRGSENVRILVDGKPSGLVGLGGNGGLSSIPSNLIEKVEVVTNPSARYDAEGEVGIINLVLKKQKKKGINGSFDFSTGLPNNHGVAINLNLRREKVNFFTNFGIGYRENRGGGDYFQKAYFFEPGSLDTSFTQVYKSERKHNRGGFNSNIQLGADYFLNDLNTLTVSGLYKYSRGSNEAEVIYTDLDYPSENELLQTVRTDSEKEPSHDGELALSYSKRFAEKERSWSTDVKYLFRDDTETSAFLEVASDGRPNLEQRSDNIEDQTNWLVRTDYIHPLPGKAKFETGGQISLREIENSYKVEQKNESDDWAVLGAFDDSMFYTENIYAAYAMFSKEMNLFSWQLGLRMEHSDITTDIASEENENNRQYTDWFPSAHLSYKLNEKNQLQLSYSRRLSRPRFWFLLPFVTFSDVRLRWQGNPALNPEYTNSFELGYLKYFEKGSMLTSLYYRHRTQVIQRLFLADENGDIDFLPVNIGTQNAYGLELSGNYDFSKVWKLNGNINVYQAKTEGEYLDVEYDAETFSWDGRVSNKVTIAKQYNAQISFTYKSGINTAQGRRNSVWAMDLGASKDVFDGKGTLSLNARDLFNTRRRRAVTDVVGLYSEQEFQWRGRTVILNLNYRLNQKKKRGRPSGGSYGE